MKSRGIKLSAIILFSLSFTALQAQTVKDIDGNVYKAVKIGSQTWMSENLKTTKYIDGKALSLITSNDAWASNSNAALPKPAYCWYENDPKNKSTYGALYNGYAINGGKLCPTGWHVSTDAEWHILVLYLDPKAENSTVESSIAGNKLKETATTHWARPNPDAWAPTPNKDVTNESGFTALPGGIRNYDGPMVALGSLGGWWSYTGEDKSNEWNRLMSSDYGYVTKSKGNKNYGYSIRCVRD